MKKYINATCVIITIIVIFLCTISASANDKHPENVDITQETTETIPTEETTPTNNTENNKPKLNGFVKINKSVFLFKNGQLVENKKVTRNNKTYITDKNGKVIANKIFKYQNKKYISDKTGALYTNKDWNVVKAPNNQYYYVRKKGCVHKPSKFKIIKWRAVKKSGVIVTKKDGVFQYKNKLYISDNKGLIYHGKSGFVKHKNNYYCYKTNGNLYRNQYFTLKNKKCYAYNSGKVEILKSSAFLNVPLINQNPELPTGCEITSVTQMLLYSGKKVDKVTLAKEMPRSSDPNKGFVGDPFKWEGWTIYPQGLKQLVTKYTGSFKDMSGGTITDIKWQITRKKPVVVWVGNFNNWNLHCIIVTGYDKTHIYYNDCSSYKKTKITIKDFKKHWSVYGNKALSY